LQADILSIVQGSKEASRGNQKELYRIEVAIQKV